MILRDSEQKYVTEDDFISRSIMKNRGRMS